MDRAALNQKVWYRALKVCFVILFIFIQATGILISKSFIDSRVVYKLPIGVNEVIVTYGNNKKVKFDQKPTESDIREIAAKYDFPRGNERILARKELIENIDAMESQGADRWEVQEYLDSLAEPYEIAGFWSDQIDTYPEDKYFLARAAGFYSLSFFSASIVIWLISRIFFYVFLRERFIVLPFKNRK